MSVAPPSRDEVARTIFVGKINDAVFTDESIDAILRSAGSLRRWQRPTDADGKKCNFGFAEYDDAMSLATAVETLKDVRIPKKNQEDNDEEQVEDDDSVAEDRKLLVSGPADTCRKWMLISSQIVVDENSLSYLEQYDVSRHEDPAAAQSRLDSAREALSAVLSELANPQSAEQKSADAAKSGDGDTMPDGTSTNNQAEVVTIPLSAEDELADIPAEMRETVAQEIAAFRERSNRRDMERLKREEELEALEKARNLGPQRPDRASSPPLQAPSGPAGGANGIPLGPRDRGIQGAPSGLKGFHGPRDYQKGVTFVNGLGMNGASQEDEDTDASDEELERRRRVKRETELEKQYLDQERRWLNRERSRTAAVEREKGRDRAEDSNRERDRDIVAKRLEEWDDDAEASRKAEEYYADRSMWIRNRATFRQREAQLDEQDRTDEERERQREAERRESAKGKADQFFERHAEELSRPSMPEEGGREPQRFKLSLGAAAQKAQAAAANTRRTVAEVEGLLEDEEEGSGQTKRTLIPIKFDSAAEAQGLTQEERDEAIRQLAQEIPSDRDGLWAWPVKWDFVDDAVVTEKLRPFVEKKIVEYLGVQEQMLVEVVEDHIRKRGSPQELLEQLDGVSLLPGFNCLGLSPSSGPILPLSLIPRHTQDHSSALPLAHKSHNPTST